ncbi:MAG: hypothetical protein ACREOG_11115, partial [Gemmatimonadaceae bacterium]
MRSTDVIREFVPGDCLRGALAGVPQRLIRYVTSIAILAALWGGAQSAEAQWAWRARLDNDAYNFWQHPAARTDEEYSNGVR